MAAVNGPDAHREVLVRMVTEQPDRLPRKMRAALGPTSGSGADDLAQEALVRALQSLAGLRGPADEALLCGWVDTIAANLIRNHWRTRSRRPCPEPLGVTGDDATGDCEPADTVEPGALVDAAASRAALAELVARLPDDVRAVFVARIVHEQPGAEVAAALGIPETTVRRRLHKARTLLRNAIDALDDGATPS